MSNEHASVKVWSGEKREDYDEILARDPDVYELAVYGNDTYHVPHEDHAVVADEMKNHGRYAFMVEDIGERVELIIETNDSYHRPKDAFTDTPPVEGGLPYWPEGHPSRPSRPFQCEIWGRIRMRVEVA